MVDQSSVSSPHPESGVFGRAVRLDALEAAWETVRDNAGGPGGDGQTLGQFAVQLPVRLMRLRRDLLAGTYRPGPLRHVDIPKDDGTTRRLSIPCISDRVVQTAVAQTLTPIVDPEMADASFGYSPGRSVARAVRRIDALRREGYGWVVDGDIEAYFDTIPHERLLDRLARSVPDPLLLDLVARWLDGFAPDGLGVAQGSPLSPLLSNLYLDDIDDGIQGRGVRLVRFADDFVLLCRREAAAVAARARMAELLSDHGLRLHPDKTRVVPFEKGFRFLGHLFVRSLVVREVHHDESTPPPDAARVLGRAIDPAAAVAEDDDGLDAHAAGLRVLYVLEPGRRLGLRNQAFAVEEDGRPILAVPPARVDRIEIGPRVEVSTEALRHALACRVPLAFVDGRGATQGSLDPAPGERAALHLAQGAAHAVPERRLALARAIVDARLRNQRALLKRLNRKRKDPEVDDAAFRIGRIVRKLRVAPDVAGAMGVEGEAAALYWPALGRCLQHGWRLRKRIRRPPPDPVNLILSFLSSLLARDIHALALRRGLHPGLGALHAARDGHHALVSDLIEEFRAPLVEGLAVWLFNARMVKDGHFVRVPEEGTVRLAPEAGRIVVRQYEAWLDRLVVHPASGRRMKWRRLIEAQVIAYGRAVRAAAGEDGMAAEVAADADGGYRPYVMDY
jgi:CRISPR-associated protein Cas1